MSGNKTYLVKGTYLVDVHTTIQANNIDEAKQKAWEVSQDINDSWTECNGLYNFQYTVEEKQ